VSKITKSQIPSTKFQINLKYQTPKNKQAPNYKHQISNKSQIPSLKFQTRAKTILLFFCLLFAFFGHWNLFVICILLFGISPFGHCYLFDI